MTFIEPSGVDVLTREELLVLVAELDATVTAERLRGDREAHGHRRYRLAWDQLSAHIDTAAEALQIAKT